MPWNKLVAVMASLKIIDAKKKEWKRAEKGKVLSSLVCDLHRIVGASVVGFFFKKIVNWKAFNMI